MGVDKSGVTRSLLMLQACRRPAASGASARICPPPFAAENAEVKDMPNKQTAAAGVKALAEPVVEGLGLILWDVELKKEGSAWFLRVYIDKEGGVTLDDCERVSRALDKPLDAADLIEQSYFLEVSSPGVERTLRRPEHFALSVGKVVRLRLFSPRDGRREYVGVLEDCGGDTLVLSEDGARHSFAAKDVALAQTVCEFI